MDLRSNIWKFFVLSLMQRRHYITILSVYFLTLPDARTQQIGIYMAAGSLASFILEIPSGYLSDNIGHKQTLILSQASLMLSTILFLLAESVVLFTLGSICLSVGFALASGTKSAFLHNTLLALKREGEYARLKSKISANVSILSAALIMLLPLLTTIAMELPIQVNLLFDLTGLIVAFLFVSPPQFFEDHPKMSVLETLRSGMHGGFYPFIIFMGAIGGFALADAGFRYPYLEMLGYPVALLGLVMGLSRVLWFLIGHNIRRIEHFPIDRVMRFDLLFFPLAYAGVALIKQPYAAGALFSIIIGYYWGRRDLYVSHLLTKVRNPNYKATVLSIQGQVQQVFAGGMAFGIGFLMQRSYSLGYLAFAAILFVTLFFSRLWVRRTAIAKNVLDIRGFAEEDSLPPSTMK